MSKTIKTAVVGPVSLSLPSDNPLTITKAGIITSASDGIDGDNSTAWNITNSGLVSATLWGINLAGGGSVTNEKGGVITGLDGISDQGFEAEPTGVGPTVTNAGIISGTQIGIEISGTVTNLSGALINGGILSSFGHLTVTNSGTITGGIHGQGADITNAKGATIIGGIGGGGGMGIAVTNAGLIEGNSGEAALDIQGYSVVNQKSGTIESSYGIISDWSSQTIVNAGIIEGTARYGDGIFLPDGTGGGSITNTGTISGGSGIASACVGSLIITNSGLISGDSFGAGVDLEFDGARVGTTITNQKGGTIIAGMYGIFSGDFISVTNQGTISGDRGIVMTAGGTVTNEKGGVIIGYLGINIENGTGTVTNAGTITTGGRTSILFGSDTTDNRLIIDPGAVFDGAADATLATISTIELAKGSGTISGIGNGNFIGFNFLDVDTGGQWKMTGANTMSTVINDGSLTVSGSLFAGTVDPTSTGLFILTSGSTLEVSQALGTAASISFAKKSELVADNYASFGGSLLTNFGGDGTVDLKDFGFANISSSTLKSGSLTLLQVMNGTQQATLDFQSSGLGNGNFQFASDQSGGVLITHA